MLVSGGKVLAIDKVKRDDTLSGDGSFVPLGVVGFLNKAEADKYYQPKGNYVTSASLNLYYTKADADSKFAEIANVYDKTATDNKFASLNNLYDPKGTASAVSAWVFSDYPNRNDISAGYYTKSEIEVMTANINATVQQFDADCINRSEKLEREINDVYQAGYVNTSGLDELPTGKAYTILWNGPGVEWTWCEASTGGGGGEGGTVYQFERGLSAEQRGFQNYLGLEPQYYDAIQHVTASADTWDTVTLKQEQLSEEQLSAISSVSSIQEEVDAALPIAGGAFIDVTESTDGVQIAYTGNSVAFIDEAQKATATAANTVYMVLSEVG